MKSLFFLFIFMIATGFLHSEQKSNSPMPQSRVSQPATVREFFRLLPKKYFTFEGCETASCDQERAYYLKKYLEVEDTANGYMKGGCDGAQSCFQMALFKRPDRSYVVGLTTSDEIGEASYFLEYVAGKWNDIGVQIVPEYGANKVYELPRYGTTIQVYENKKIEGEEYTERGRKLYDLLWRNGKFVIEKTP